MKKISNLKTTIRSFVLNMMKINLSGFFLLTALTGCDNLTQEQYQNFSYTETIGGYGTEEDYPKVWKLECKNLNCILIQTQGVSEKILLQKQITLKDEKEQKELLLSIIKGMKKGRKMKDALDFTIDNKLILGDKTKYNANVINQNFLDFVDKCR